MYKLFMALRYLRAHRIIYFSIAGVAIGILTIVVVTSIMGGFRRDMRERIRGMQSHIVVKSVDKNVWLANYDDLCDDLEKVPHVVGAAPRIEYDAWLGYQSIRTDAHFVGIDPAREQKVSKLPEYFRSGGKEKFDFTSEGELPGAVVGSQVYAGAKIDLMTARDSGPVPILCRREFEVVGRFESGMSEYDATFVFMDIGAAQGLLQVERPGRANVIAVAVDDYEKHGETVRESILERLHERNPNCNALSHAFDRCGKFRILTWEQVRRNLLSAVDVERGIMIIVLFFIVLVAGFNIIAIYTLVVKAKTRDIGILRALGATEGGVTSIFLASGGLCGLLGSVFGIILGLLFSFNVNAIADLLRTVTRELNKISRGELVWVAVALQGALAMVLIIWWIFYRQGLRHPWGRMIGSVVVLGVGSWAATSWMEAYEPGGRHDPVLTAGSRLVWVGGVVALWTLMLAAWRFMDRWRRRPAWIFFGFAWTILLGIVTLGVAAMALAADLILGLNPRPGWRGLELFPSDIYYLDRIPVLVDYGGIGLIVGLTLIISLVFSVYPALRAAACNPIEAIRDE